MLKSLSLIAIGAVLAVSATSTPVAAAQCKGLDEGGCKGNQACLWVPETKNKNDTTIPARCVSVCKGLDKEACSSNAACDWKDEFTRKDGQVAKARCVEQGHGKGKSVGKKAGEGEKKAEVERQKLDSSVSTTPEK